MALGFVIHVVEANLVVPLLTQAKVEIPPVLSMMSVLIVGRLLGPAGLLIAVPLLAVCIVLVKRVLIQEVYGVDALPEVSAPLPGGGVTAELQARAGPSSEAGAGAV
jgi:predicted PurR-regulated permease PerM